jgi:hypothetical protein
MSNFVGISLDTIPNDTFSLEVREYRPRIATRKCPGTAPLWVKDLVKSGIDMPLRSLVAQSGLHFSRSVNPMIFAGSPGKRQRAAALAWGLISMVAPFVENDLLWVEDPGDQDIKRLCSEILGVGAGLQLLIQNGLIDGRTLRKISDRFDFRAKSIADRKRVYIEAKGTFNGVSISEHRASFSRKLTAPGLFTASRPRGYARAIGIVFSTWTKDAAKRRADVELLDPEEESEETFEEMVREVVGFYASVLDEAVGKRQGAAELQEVTQSEDLFRKAAPPPIRVARSKTIPIAYHSATLRLLSGDDSRTFMGSFWEARTIVAPPVFKGFDLRKFPFAYVGIDREVWLSIEDRNFERLLSLNHGEERFLDVSAEKMTGLFYVDRYAVLRAWLSEIPDNVVDFHVEGSL